MLTVLWQTKSKVSFLLEDKHVENGHHVIRKSHDATEKNCPHVVHFNVPRDWFETNSGHQKHYSKGGKKICGCRGLLGRVIWATVRLAISKLYNYYPITNCATNSGICLKTIAKFILIKLLVNAL